MLFQCAQLFLEAFGTWKVCNSKQVIHKVKTDSEYTYGISEEIIELKFYIPKRKLTGG